MNSTRSSIAPSARPPTWEASGARSRSPRRGSTGSTGSRRGVGRLPLVVAEHGAILDALDGGDRERAAERLDYHLERAPAIMETLIGSHEKYFVE